MDAETRAQEARALTENETLRAAIDRIERDAIEKMIEGSDLDRRRNADYVKAIREFRQTLQMWAVSPPKAKTVV